MVMAAADEVVFRATERVERGMTDEEVLVVVTTTLLVVVVLTTVLEVEVEVATEEVEVATEEVELVLVEVEVEEMASAVWETRPDSTP